MGQISANLLLKIQVLLGSLKSLLFYTVEIMLSVLLDDRGS